MPDSTSLKLLHDQSPTLSIGVMTADMMSLGSEVRMLEECGARMVHFDVMDGVYCPHLTAGPPFIRAFRTPLLKDVHLMIAEPLGKVAEYVSAGADVITFHPEASAHPHRVLQEMGAMQNTNDPARGLIRGVALTPGSPLSILDPLLDDLEMVLLLAVNPGWGGQKFSPSTFGRIESVKEMIGRTGKKILLAVDGGITRQNAAEIARTGADIIVSGSAIFDGKTPKENAQQMLSAVKSPKN